jgi:dihydroorotase
MCSTNPARIFNLDGRGTLTPGSVADVTLIDPNLAWKYSNADSRSRSRNSPFDGRQFHGGAVTTIVGGKIVYDRTRD